MTRDPRRCLFCDDRASTKEDAWPLWLVRKFPTPIGVSVEAQRRDAPPMTWRQKGHFAKARFACQACNNGWMSALENAAKPVIERLFDDAACTLAERDREIAARWVLKTAMVFEALGGKDWFYTKEERSIVRTGSIPPGYTAFWVARCVDLPGAYSAANNMFESAETLRDGVHGHVTTLAIGPIAFQVLTVRPTPAVPTNAKIELPRANVDPWPRTALQLWPPTVDLVWPPEVGLRGELGIEALTNRFRLEPP